MCTNIQMELCDAWTRSHGISLSEHVPSRSSLDHVFSVRLDTFYLYLSLYLSCSTETCDEERHCAKVSARNDLSSKETFDFPQLSWKLETAEVENERQTCLCSMCTTILPDLTAFTAALLFAVHPIHTEAVSIAFKTSFVFECSCNVQSNSTTYKSWKFNLRMMVLWWYSTSRSYLSLSHLIHPPEKNVLGMFNILFPFFYN